MTTIVQKEDKVLREIAKDIPPDCITHHNTRKIINDMKEALAVESDGVGLAAPQIGVSLRIFIVSGKIFIDPKDNETKKIPPDLVFINPTIIKKSKKIETLDEGCLSVRHWYGKVKRADKVTVRAYDEHGEKNERGGSGLLAQIFQHEIDHLNGILFTDTAKDMREVEDIQSKQ